MKHFLYYALIITACLSTSQTFAAQTLTFEGKVTTHIVRFLTVPFPSYIDERLVSIGDEVKKGQPLVRYHLHPREKRAFQAELYTGGSQAEIQMQLGSLEQEILHSATQKRTSAELAAKGLTSASDTQRNNRLLNLLQQRKEALLQKKKGVSADFNLHMAELETYFGHKLQKGDTLPQELFLTSPMDGTVINIAPGARPMGVIDPNVPIVSVADLDPLQIQIQVYESEVSRMKIGQEVLVEIVNMGNKQVKGKISMLSWLPIDGSIAVPSFYFVYIDIENPDHMIRPGYKASVHITVE